MYLEHLDLRSAPGLPSGVQLTDLAPGCVLLLGPNASGKSTIGRTLRGALWPDRAPGGVDAQTVWRVSEGGPTLRATTVFGRSQWDTEDAPCPAPELADAAQLTLRDLILPNDGSDASIAKQIQRELDGGYDLSGLRPVTDERVRPRPKVAGPWKTANADLRRALGAADALAREEKTLDGLKASAAQAAGAPARLAVVRQAMAAAEAAQEVATRQQAVDALGDAGAALPVDAVERAREATERARQAQDDVNERRRLVADAQQAVDANAFPAARPAESALAAEVDRARSLEQARAALQEAEEAAAAARALRDTRAAEVWAQAGPEAPAPSPAQTRQLEDALAAVTAARAALDGIGPAPEAPDRPHDPAVVDALREGRMLLRHWLAAPRPMVVAEPPAPAAPPWAMPALVGGVVLLLAGLAAAVTGALFLGPLLVGLGLGLVGVFAGAALQRRSAPAAAEPPASEADALAARYRGDALPAVSSWTVEAVEEALNTIDARLRALERAQTQEGERIRHEAERARRAATLADAEAARDALVSALGLDAAFAGLSLIHQAGQLHALSEARTAAAAAEATLRQRTEAVAEEAKALRVALEALALPDALDLRDPAHLLPAAEAALSRAQTLRQAEASLADRSAELDRAEATARAEAAARDALLDRFGVAESELDALPARVARAQERAAAEQALREAQADHTRLATGLPDDLPEDLAAEVVRLEALAERHASLAGAVAEVEARISDATASGTIGEALARQEEGLEILARDRDQQLVARAQGALCRWLEAERRQNDAPALLQRARSRFLSFTHGRYELDVRQGGGFAARDLHTGRLQRLSELSDGTRIQLLLAARLAYLEEVEGAVPTPLFLDEVLSTTDQDRFDAVAGAILQLCAEGRQVFYATSSPDEVRAWRAVAARAGFAAPTVCALDPGADPADWAPAPATPAARPELPDTTGHDAVSWCAAVGLPRPGLSDALAQWPLPLVLFDALPAVRAAAAAGADRVAHLDLAADGVPLPLDPALQDRAAVRARALRAALRALRRGRGRPVTWEVAQASGAISATFRDRAKEKLLLHADDAAAFVKAVAGLPRFRETSAQQLAEHLTQVGVLDPDPALTRSEAVAQVQRAVAADLEAGALDLAEVDRLVGWCADVVGVAWPEG